MSNANQVDVHTLAKFFNRDVRTMQLWVNDGMPRETRGMYDFVKCVRWRIDKLESENEILKTTGDEKLHELRIRDQAIKNKRGELSLKRDLAQLIDKKQVLIAFSNQNSVINFKINNLMNDLLRELKESLDSKQVKKLREHFNETKDTISKLKIDEYIVNEDKIHTDKEQDEPDE